MPNTLIDIEYRFEMTLDLLTAILSEINRFFFFICFYFFIFYFFIFFYFLFSFNQ
jgi:hypothetical protein